MAINFTNLGASTTPDIASATDATSYATSSWTPPSSGLIILSVFNRFGTPPPNTPTVSGNSITWTQVVTYNPSTDTQNRLTIFGANASGSTTGATTIDMAGQLQLGCHAHFCLADGVDLTGGVAAAFVQTVTNTSASGNGTITLAAAGSADNRPYSFWWHAVTEATTPRAGWTELDDTTSGGPNVGIESQYRGDAFETTASATWTSNTWGGIAAEIKAAAAAGGGDVIDPIGMRGFFGA